MATPFTVRSTASSTTTFRSTGTTMSAESAIAAASDVTGEGRGGAVATAISEAAGRRWDKPDMLMLSVEGTAAAASDEIAGAGGAADWDAPAEQVEAQFEPAWERGLLSDWLGGL
jgi:hypothetical protein